jgi:hypothetical protein
MQHVKAGDKSSIPVAQSDVNALTFGEMEDANAHFCGRIRTNSSQNLVSIQEG